MLFTKLSNFETFSLARVLCRLTLGIAALAFVVSTMTLAAYARCGLLTAEQLVVQVERLTKFDADDLALMPVQHFVYENGVLRTSFSQTSQPCKGPACRESKFPLQNLPLTTVASSGSGSVNGIISRCFALDDTMICIDRVRSIDLERKCDRDRPALHPPSL